MFNVNINDGDNSMTLLSTVYKNDWLTLTFDILLFLHHPIKRILVSVNQLSYLIFSVYNIFNKKSRRPGFFIF